MTQPPKVGGNGSFLRRSCASRPRASSPDNCVTRSRAASSTRCPAHRGGPFCELGRQPRTAPRGQAATYPGGSPAVDPRPRPVRHRTRRRGRPRRLPSRASSTTRSTAEPDGSPAARCRKGLAGFYPPTVLLDVPARCESPTASRAAWSGSTRASSPTQPRPSVASRPPVFGGKVDRAGSMSSSRSRTSGWGRHRNLMHCQHQDKHCRDGSSATTVQNTISSDDKEVPWPGSSKRS